MASAGSEILVSVILPVRNEERYIRRVLGDLAAQDFPKDKLEIFVVDGQSSDRTVTEATDAGRVFPSFSVIENPRRLSSAARSIGARAARGKYLLFVDGHCHIPSQTLISDMVVIFSETGADALCRPQPLTLQPQTRFQLAVALARASHLGHGLDSTIYSDQARAVKAASAGAMYRREVFDKVGYFDESFDACEDVEFNTRVDQAGLKAFISPKLTVEYAARRSFPGLFRQLYRYGYGRWKLFRKHRSTLGAGTLVTTAFALAVLLYPLMWLLSFKIAVAATVVAVIYLVAVILSSATIAAKARRASLYLLLPPIYFTIHFALGFGFLVSMVRGRK